LARFPAIASPRLQLPIPRWGVSVAAHLLESKAWAIYREREKRFASLIGGRAPGVLHRQLPGMGMAKRYIIAIADDNRAALASICASSLRPTSPAT